MTADAIAKVSPLLAEIGASFYFRPETVAAGKDHGLDGFRFYFLGRGGVLGDVEASVARSAFGYFEPGLFAKMWDSARERADVGARDIARSYINCAHEFGRRRFADLTGLDEFCSAASKLDEAIDPTGLPLYAGVRAEPRPDDVAARAFHLAMVLREARGSIHLLALVASGIDSRLAHVIRRPDDLAMFGWTEGVDVTDDHRHRWNTAEALTDHLLEPPYATLTDDETAALLAGAEAMWQAATA